MFAKDDIVDLTSSTKMQNPILPHLISLLLLETGNERKISSFYSCSFPYIFILLYLISSFDIIFVCQFAKNKAQIPKQHVSLIGKDKNVASLIKNENKNFRTFFS